MKNWKENLNTDSIEWLLESHPWTRYKTMIDILGMDTTGDEVQSAKNDLLNHEMVISLAEETKDWMPVSATRNSDPKITYFKLRMMADFGVRHHELGLKETVEKASEQIIDNQFGVRGQTPERPKKGEKYEKPDLAADVWHISPCNSPVVLLALMELGVSNDLVKEAVDDLKEKWKDSTGWFCHFFFVESQFKKLSIGCPIAGLQALDVFSKVPDLKESAFARNAFEPIKFHQEYGKTLYYFGRSKKFWTMKYPFVWYNALYLADVLTRFDFLKKEPVVMELIDWIEKSQDENGRFKPGSVFLNYKGWDFANKKEASPWITFLSYRILKQFYS